MFCNGGDLFDNCSTLLHQCIRDHLSITTGCQLVLGVTVPSYILTIKECGRCCRVGAKQPQLRSIRHQSTNFQGNLISVHVHL